jgi:hypothetical protein
VLVLRCVPHRDGPVRPTIQVPAGCLDDQTGEYLHAQNPAYRYRGRDDGGTLVLLLEEGPADGGPRPAHAGAPRVVLERTPHGFVGRTEARAFAGAGQSCPVTFPTEVVACAQDALTLRAAMSAQVNELCQAPAPAPSVPAGAMLEHRLLRAADGGTR